MRNFSESGAYEYFRQKLGDRVNFFCQDGWWYVGVFLDDGLRRDVRGGVELDHQGKPKELAPHWRKQRIYAMGQTIEELVYNFERGHQPGALGFTPVVDKLGQIKAFRRPDGLTVKSLPRPYQQRIVS